MEKTTLTAINRSLWRLVRRAALVALVMISSAAAMVSTARAASVRELGPMPVHVLLLVPAQFEQFTYTSFIKGRETVHAFGEEAEEQFKDLLGPLFERLVIRPVGSEVEALDMLSSDSPENEEVRTFDYVAIPKFISVTSWSRTFKYQFEIELLMEIHATDNSNVTRLKGYGRTTAGNFASTTPLRAGNRVLWNAIDAIRDGLEEKRDVLAPVSGASPAKAPQPLYEPEARTAPDADVTPVPVRVLLLVPDEFRAFVYTSLINGASMDHAFGEDAEEQIGRLFGSSFQYLVTRPVSSGDEARDMLSPDSPGNEEVRDFDYVAVPKFADVRSWTKRSRFGFEIDLLIEFYSTNGLKIVRIKGYGDHSADFQGISAPTPWEAGTLTLESAIRAIGDTIDRRRDLFTS